MGFGIPPVSDLPWNYYTHIMHFAAAPNSNGTVSMYALTRSDIKALIASRPPGKKVIVEMADTGCCWPQATSPETIATFVNNIVNFVNSNGYDGVDLDWEHNINTTQYVDLVMRLRNAMPTKLITMAVNADMTAVAAASQSNLDQINMMNYDMWGGTNLNWFNDAIFSEAQNSQWSCSSLAQRLMSAGVAAGKLGVGIPFYGNRWTGCTYVLQSGCQGPTNFFYRDLVTDPTRWQPQYRFYDDTYKSNYLSIPALNEFDSYNGPEFIADLVPWAKSKGFGGFMTFSIGYEYLSKLAGPARYPLSAALYGAVFDAQPQTVSVTPNQPLSFTFKIGGTVPASQKITVTSTGGPVRFSVDTTSGGWLSVDASSGSTPKDVNVSVNPQGLGAGTYTGSISISAPGVLQSPLVINVTLSMMELSPPQPFTITSTASNLAGLIAPGEEITIKGSSLGPAEGVLFNVNAQGLVDPILAGVRVLFDGTPGTPTFVSATQINVVVPFEIAGNATTNLVVEFQGVQSAPSQQLVSSVAPGIYTLNFTGQGQAAVANQDGTINGPPGGVSTPGGVIATKPAPQNTAISVYMTGGGQTNPPSITGSVNIPDFLMPLVDWSPTSGTVTATIGGVPARVEFAGTAPGLVAGMVQVNVRVPMGVSGDELPIVITINRVSTSPSPLAPTIAVR